MRFSIRRVCLAEGPLCVFFWGGYVLFVAVLCLAEGPLPCTLCVCVCCCFALAWRKGQCMRFMVMCVSLRHVCLAEGLMHVCHVFFVVSALFRSRDAVNVYVSLCLACLAQGALALFV